MTDTSTGPRILLYDLETSPILGYVWTLWKTNVIEVVEDWYLLSAAWQWYGEDQIHFARKAKGYANGVEARGRQIYVGGQIGWNSEQKFETFDFIGQMEQTLRNIVSVVEAAEGKATDIVRLTWYVTDKKEYLARQSEVGAAYRRVLGRHFPAMTMIVVAGLVEDDALIEIEATAVIAD